MKAAEGLPVRPPTPLFRASTIARFLGMSLLGIGLLMVGVAIHASLMGNNPAYELDLELVFVLAGLGVVVLGLSGLLGAMERK